jgi:hypothetical protein
MKRVLLLVILLSSTFTYAQEESKTIGNKGEFYFYWGWNGSSFSKSDIQFTGNDYDFTLHNVVANDRQSQFGLDPYFNPVRMTIPQYNFRLGYYFKDNWDISIAVDHMKYVVARNQTVKIDGTIGGTGTVYDGSYNNQDIVITDDFLFFEHTDGLNYVNTELRHTDNIYTYAKFDLDLIEGAGIGFLYPKTNTTLLNKARYDEFHLAGYGLSALIAGRVTFNKKYFVQSEFKVGYINMPNIRTTMSADDIAKQHFTFSQWNILFGGVINIGKK